MAYFGRRSCYNNDNYDCNVHMNVVSGATNTNNVCGCGCCSNCCCNCGCNGNVGGVGTCRNCGPCQYVTNADCDCDQVVDNTCGCGIYD